MKTVYLVGEPGIGKSTAMAELTSPYSRTVALDQPARELLWEGAGLDFALRAVELGRSAKHHGEYPGTDAMAMNAVVGVERWLLERAASETKLVLGEGARLGVKRFLHAAVEMGPAIVVHIEGPEVASARRGARGSRQNPSWIKGARTRARRFAEYADHLNHCAVVWTTPDEVLSVLRAATGLGVQLAPEQVFSGHEGTSK